MAGTGVMNQADELAALKSTFPGQVKVISGVGDFSNVVTVQPTAINIQCKFQLSDGYPVTVPTIFVRSDALSSDQAETLSRHLATIAESYSSKPMLQPLVTECLQWLKDEGIHATSVEKEKTKKKGKQRRPQKEKVQSNTHKDSSEASTYDKKPPMKTAADVIKRIQWDPSVDQDCFVVGYMDRITGLEEKLFSSFTWEDLASVDQFCLAIPQHRIQYFKYKTEKVWDKNIRLDNVFGSTGSKMTILEAMKAYDDKHEGDGTGASGGGAEGVGLREKEVELPGQEAGLPKWDDGEPEGAEQYWDGADQHQVGVTEDAQEDLSSCQHKTVYPVNPTPVTDEQLYQEQVRSGGLKRPNYFVALEITNETTISNLTHMQRRVCTSHPQYKPYIIPRNGFHLTLACAALESPSHIATCVQTLAGIQSDLIKLAQECPSLSFDGLDHFYGNVIFAKVKFSQVFLQIVDLLRSSLANAGVNIHMDSGFKPHLTLFKVNRKNKQKQNWRKYVSSLSVVKQDFGEQRVDNIQLCQMGTLPDLEAGETGFYTNVFRLVVPKV